MPYFFGFNALYFLLRPASSQEIQHRACPGFHIAQYTRIWHVWYLIVSITMNWYQ